MAHRLSTKQLADRIGMTQRNIHIWESGERGDPPWYVLAVLHYIDCPVVGDAWASK